MIPIFSNTLAKSRRRVILRHASRIREACSEVGDPDTRYKDVELDALRGGEWAWCDVVEEELGATGEEGDQKRDCGNGELRGLHEGMTGGEVR